MHDVLLFLETDAPLNSQCSLHTKCATWCIIYVKVLL